MSQLYDKKSLIRLGIFVLSKMETEPTENQKLKQK